MAKGKAPAKVEEKAPAKVEEKVNPCEDARLRNKGVDMFSPASGFDLHLPTSDKRAFLAKAELFDVQSRLGEGPCIVAIKFMLPNGDMILAGDTFDPVIERMSPGKYQSLKARKYFSLADKKYEPKFK